MIEIYGQKNCVWCDKAKSLLDGRGLYYSYFDIGTDITKEEFKEKFPDQKKVPLIFVNGEKLADGYTSLVLIVDDISGGFGDDFR